MPKDRWTVMARVCGHEYGWSHCRRGKYLFM